MSALKTTTNDPKLWVKIWGARGSLPAPHLPTTLVKMTEDLFRDFFAYGGKSPADVPGFLNSLPRHRHGGYGGNTPCVEVKSPTTQVIVDGGSGIRMLGYDLMSGPCGKGKGEIHILFTHFHWDHLIGLPFFTPIFIPGNTIHLYSVQPELSDVFKVLFKKPYFPVPLEGLGAKLVHHQIKPREKMTIGDINFTPYELDHPDPCWGYKFEREGRVYSHCVDTECTRVSRDELGADLPLYQGVDLMVFDAQYTLMETVEKVNWGHAAASLGLDIAMREKIRRVVFMHHDPASSNEKIATAEAQARKYYDNQLKAARRAGIQLEEVDWCFGHEGLLLEV